MLATAGRLDLNRGGAPVTSELKMVEMRDNGAEARKITEAADRSVSRSVYLPLLRGVTPRSLEAFDPVSQTLVSGARENTTVPTQALYLLNSTFVRQQALAFAERITSADGHDDDEAIRDGYLRVLGRAPSEGEVARARHFLGKNLHESRQIGDLACIGHGKSELSRRRRRVEGITLNGALELAQGTLERWRQSGCPGCRDNSTATADDEWIAKRRAQTRERVADRGRGHVKAPCCAHDAPLRQHRIEHPE